MADKRKSPPLQNGAGSSSSSVLVKRQRQGDNDAGVGERQIAIASSDGGKSKGLIRTVKRTSNLSAPILSLSGAHGAEILDVKFSPDGQLIAAASSDKTICESLLSLSSLLAFKADSARNQLCGRHLARTKTLAFWLDTPKL